MTFGPNVPGIWQRISVGKAQLYRSQVRVAAHMKSTKRVWIVSGFILAAANKAHENTSEPCVFAALCIVIQYVIR